MTDFLVVGHIVKDVLPGGGWRLGGSVAYAACQARRLGLSVAAVTSCAPDLSPAEALPGVLWHVVPSPVTTTFENRYEGDRRSQHVSAVASLLSAPHLPPSWRRAPLALLAPVAGEVDPRLAAVFPEESHVGIGAQGWLRRIEDGRVSPGTAVGDASWLAGADTVFVSEEDVDDPEEVWRWRCSLPVVILTRGRRGCTLWDESGRHDCPGFQVAEADPTGAGDVFAAAYLVRLRETGDPMAAARFANAAAALSVRGAGLSAIAGRDEVEALLASAGGA
jgi:hypothetical protein